MKKFFVLYSFLLFLTAASAQSNHRRFNPSEFQAHLEQFIATEAGLSPQEAEVFFPIFREMQKKQRVLFEEQRRLRHIKPANEEACRDAVMKIDENELQMKELQQIYHKRFFAVLSASKVFDVLKAEARFHRKAFKQMAGNRNKKK